MHTITRATETDAAELNKLINSAYRGESSKQGWTTEAHLLEGVRCDVPMLVELLNRPDTIFLKYVENYSILGCVRLDTHGDRLYLGMLSVSPTLQGGGIGKKLLKASEEEAARQQRHSIYMTVISVRTELVEWYERHGYIRTGEVQPFEVEHPNVASAATRPLEFLVLEKKLNA